MEFQMSLDCKPHWTEKQMMVILQEKQMLNHSHSYGSLTDIPTSFKPEAHNHTISNVVALQTKLNEKADLDHSHSYGSLTDIPTTFTPAVHNHGISDVTGLQAALDGKTTSAYVDAGDNFIIDTKLAGLSFWKGTQTEYDAIGTPSATTLYFIVG